MIFSNYLTIFLFVFPSIVFSFRCYTCQNGYESQTPCSNRLPSGMWDNCDQPNSECVQAIEWFQNGALRLAVRKCWTPSSNNTQDYCKSYKNKVGKLKFCETCKTDLCNNKILYKPSKTCHQNNKKHLLKQLIKHNR